MIFTISLCQHHHHHHHLLPLVIASSSSSSQVLSTARLSLLSNGSLIIHHLQPQDEGEYRWRYSTALTTSKTTMTKTTRTKTTMTNTTMTKTTISKTTMIKTTLTMLYICRCEASSSVGESLSGSAWLDVHLAPHFPSSHKEVGSSLKFIAPENYRVPQTM